MNYFLVIVIGLMIGSFLNCLIWRLYKNETLMGRSYCPNCRHQISWYDNIPVLSFILLNGKCRNCKQKISWQYPAVELITAFLFLISYHLNVGQEQFSLLILRDWLLIITLIIVFVHDARWQTIPMTLIYPMTVVLFVVNFLLGVIWWQLFLMAAIGAGFFLIQYIITKKKGIGEGDIWLGLLLGVAIPFYGQFLLLITLTYSIGSLFSIVLLLMNKSKWQSKIALGPFLALGALITIFWGEKIINWYLQIL